MINQLNKTSFITYTFALLMFFLPLWRWIENILLGLLIIVFFISKKRKIELGFILKTSAIIFTFYVALRSLLASNIFNDVSAIVGLLPLLLIPFVFMNLTKEQITTGLLSLFLGILVMQIIACAGIVDYLFFFEGKKVRLANYAKVNEIINFERPYLGFFSALNVILAYHFFTVKKQWYYLLAIIVSFFIISVISARLGFIILVFTTGVLTVHKLKKSLKFLVPIILIMGCVFTYFTTQKTSLMQRFYSIKKDSRNIIWKGAINQIEQTRNYIFGNGKQHEIREKLLHYYKYEARIKYRPEKLRFIKKNYNVHNQFLNEYVRGGGVGLTLFLFPFLYLFYKNCINFNITAILFLTSIFLFCFVENILERQKGVYLLAIILATISTCYEKK